MNWSEPSVPNSAGQLRPSFAAVADAFAANFADGEELGAAFAVMIDGELVVDIRGGYTDRNKEEPWTERTLACVYSSSKAVLSLLVAHEVSKGRLDYDAPVARYWPEFAQAGKEGVTLADVLSHQAGLCGIRDEMPPESWLDWEAITARLAAMEPLWTPGAANGYHPQTVGYISGELLRRVTGQSVGEILRALSASRPFDIYCGLHPPEIERAAYMPKPPRAPDLGALNQFKQLAFLKPWSAPAKVSYQDWMAAELPSSNMHADARSLASVLHPFANGGRWGDEQYLTQGVIDAALAERCRGDDLVLPFELSWSAGLMRNINRHFGPNENAFGHAGFGGSCVIVDLQHHLTAAYVMNKMGPYLVGDPRPVRLLNALYASL